MSDQSRPRNCLPSCINPAEDFHHLRCPNHPQAAELAEAVSLQVSRLPAAAGLPAAFRQAHAEEDGKPQLVNRRGKADPLHSYTTADATDDELARYRRERHGGGGGLSTRWRLVILFFSLSFFLYRSPIIKDLSRDFFAADTSILSAEETAEDALEDGSATSEAVETAAAPTVVGTGVHQPLKGADEQKTVAIDPNGQAEAQPRKRGFWRRALGFIGVGRREPVRGGEGGGG